MSELFSKNLKNALAEIKQQAKQSIKEAEVSATATTTDGTKEVSKKKSAATKNTGDVKPETPTACEEIDDTQAKKDIAERMRQRLLQLTQDHDSKYLGR